MLFLATVELCHLRTKHCISHPFVGLLVWLYELYPLLWFYLHWLIMLAVPMEPLLMTLVSQICPSFHIEYMQPIFSHHFPYAFVRRKLKPDSPIPQLSWLCMSAIPGTITGSCTSCSLISSTLYILAEYLVLDGGGCLNALLPTNSIPSTSYHLFWNRILESFECLEIYSHQL